jgi:dTDP-4-dehydrorhamnose 3,5-epimerase
LKVMESTLEGLKVIEPEIYGDHRGWFMETYNDAKFKDAGIDVRFVQDNHSFSATQGTIRGLHYQLNPKSQTKLVRCTRGVIFDVVVDIRKGSPSFGKWYGIELSAENKKQLFVPKGFAHGFMTLTDDVEVLYKVDELYSPENDRGIIWNDTRIGINWPTHLTPILSGKDGLAPILERAEINFVYGDD